MLLASQNPFRHRSVSRAMIYMNCMALQITETMKKKEIYIEIDRKVVYAWIDKKIMNI